MQKPRPKWIRDKKALNSFQFYFHRALKVILTPVKLLMSFPSKQIFRPEFYVFPLFKRARKISGITIALTWRLLNAITLCLEINIILVVSLVQWEGILLQSYVYILFFCKLFWKKILLQNEKTRKIMQCNKEVTARFL